MRVNLSLAITEMVVKSSSNKSLISIPFTDNPSEITLNPEISSVSSESTEDGFDWDEQSQGFILGSLYWGSLGKYPYFPILYLPFYYNLTLFVNAGGVHTFFLS